MAAPYSDIASPWWQEVWIVAGGPSAQKFDVGRLRGTTVLAVNDGIDLIPSSIAASLVSLDHRWICRRRDFLESFDGEKFLAVPLESFPHCASIRGAQYLQWSQADGLSEDPGFICTGGNSGYGAIGVAYLKRAEVIHLVGYDMDPRTDDKWAHWAPRFRMMLPQLAARGVRVINHNPDSCIDAFPKTYCGEVIGSPA